MHVSYTVGASGGDSGEVDDLREDGGGGGGGCQRKNNEVDKHNV